MTRSIMNEIKIDFINDFFSSIPDPESSNLYYVDKIPEKEIEQARNTFSGHNIGDEKILLLYNTVPTFQSTVFLLTEKSAYWYLPKFPGGGARKGKIELKDLGTINLTEYKFPVIGDKKAFKRLLSFLGTSYAISCNGNKIGVLSGENKKDFSVLNLLFSKLDSDSGKLTEEEIKELESKIESEVSDTWSPCPRCESKKVTESNKEYYICLFLMVWLFFFFGIQFSWIVAIIIGIAYMIGWEILVGTIWKCKDCGNRWRNKSD